jgi:uncharacterized protein YegL
MSAGIEMDVIRGEGLRRLPVYLLLDCSSSMAGAPIEAVMRGVEHFIQDVSADQFAQETVHIGVITFGGAGAQMVTKTGASSESAGLTPIAEFKAPQLTATGGTPLGAAFRELAQSIDRDVRPTVAGQPKGDWKPLAFILTDGAPTDDWRTARQDIEDRTKSKLLNVISVGCGPGINREKLKAIAIGPTFVLDEANGKYFAPFFKWVTQSVQQVSKALSEPGGGERRAAELPPPPPQVVQLTF